MQAAQVFDCGTVFFDQRMDDGDFNMRRLPDLEQNFRSDPGLTH
jgi:hypothetical protein